MDTTQKLQNDEQPQVQHQKKLKEFWGIIHSKNKYLIGDWMNHLSIPFYQGLTSTNQIDSRIVLPAAEPIQTLTEASREKSQNIFSIERSLQFFFHWKYSPVLKYLMQVATSPTSQGTATLTSKQSLLLLVVSSQCTCLSNLCADKMAHNV